MTASGIVKPGDFGCSENSTAFPEMETGQNEIEAQGEPLRNSPAWGNLLSWLPFLARDQFFRDDY